MLNLDSQTDEKKPELNGVQQNTSPQMRVKKRSGELVSVDVRTIVDRVQVCADGLDKVDCDDIARRAITGLYDGAKTSEIDMHLIHLAAGTIGNEPQHSKLAARLLGVYIQEEVETQGIESFSDSIKLGKEQGLIDPEIAAFVEKNSKLLNHAIDTSRNDGFEYFGLRTLYDRYFLRHPENRFLLETPQYFFMRVACGLAESAEDVVEFYSLISTLDYLPSTPTLFNSATNRPQMSSCYLLDSPQDDLKSIYNKYSDIAMLSKFAGGIGVAYHRIRSRGSLIRGTNGYSNGTIPWLKTLDSSVAAVNQGGKRKGACCVYLESWHGDIEEFLELRDNTGDEAKRAFNLNFANWIPDLFMKRVKEDGDWSLFDPKDFPEFPDLFGEAFEKAYLKAESEEKYVRQVKARVLYGRMMKTLAETGNGWMTFKDASNSKCNQTGESGKVVHLSNLCTEILEVTDNDNTAVCNLGSVNLSQHVKDGRFDFEKLEQTVKTAVKYLDRVIDRNFYPTGAASNSNLQWRPIGLGIMGLQDVFFKLKLPYDSEAALKLSTKIQKEIYFSAVSTSCGLAKKLGAHPGFEKTRAAQGKLQFDLWGETPSEAQRWDELKAQVKEHGLRNSLMIAIAPTATIASIVGCYEAMEPQVSNLFKRETLSGEFMQVNKYLVNELQERNLWTEAIRNKIKMNEGSISNIEEIPQELRQVYRTAWELPQKALIDMAAARGAYIDQSQSLNLFMESPNIGKLSSMYMYAWEKGLKTTYYLRSRPATRVAKTTVDNARQVAPDEAIACSLENPEACESCQ